MTPERHALLTDLLDQMLDTPTGERDKFLDAACRQDRELRAELESLIASLENDPEFIEKPALPELVGAGSGDGSSLEAEPMAGKMIGRYRLVREIGHGGMGSVYLAERADDEYRNQVALKLVRHGLQSNFAIRRFVYERQTLAALHHPNIAALLDGGTTEDGLPYLVMEYVEGETISQYCDLRQLPINERLKLFRAVCAAVHYAHQSLVIHRDLKPANLMVTADGQVKLLDFGIAKILNREIAGTLQQTETAVRLMTPEYASPEQVRGGKITTASDVYSLGVILYELLSGHRPYQIASWLPSDIERAICQTEPVKPSTAVLRREEIPSADGQPRIITPEAVAEARAEAPPKLRRHLSGDLDTIVLMALRKEPERRYASVNGLSEDIRRYLEGLPVTARPDTFSYRASKFVRRHKAGVAAVALIVLALLAGLFATLWQARLARIQQVRAERLFNDVRGLSKSVLFDIHDKIQFLEDSNEARELIAKRALDYLDRLATDSAGDMTLRQELAEAYLKVGDVQGRPGFPSLGDRTSALDSYQKSLAIYQTLPGNDPMIRKQMAISLLRIGDVQQMLRSASSLASYQQALQTAESAPETCGREIALCQQRIGVMKARTGDLDGARPHLQLAIKMAEDIAAKTEFGTAAWCEAQRDVSINLIKDGDVSLVSDDTKTALAQYRRARGISQQIAGCYPAQIYQRELAASFDKVGNALAALDDATGALNEYREALRIREPLAAANKKSVEHQRDVSISHDKIGGLLADAGKTAEAIEAFQSALEIDTKLSLIDQNDNQTKLDRANSLTKLGELRQKLGNSAKALDDFRQAFALLAEVVAKDDRDVTAKRDLASAAVAFGELSLKMPKADLNEAKTKLQQCLDVLGGLQQKGIARDSDKEMLAKAQALFAKLGK
ncbi:MAG: serine/threonine protein kinase [Acidobacteria bacterium]|nr:serine/threonine protein kinase [Acidobacteriota bacterium]